MRQKTLPSFFARGLFVLACFLLFAVTLSSFSAKKGTEDIWKMLGITKEMGTEKIKNSFMYGYLDHYGLKNLKSIAMNDRATIAKDLLVYTKQFVNTAAFIKDYDQRRNDSRPPEPETKKLRSIEEIQKDQIAETEKAIKDAEKMIKEMPDVAKSLQPVIDMQKKTLKEYQDPNNKLFSAIAQGEKYEQEDRIRRYKEDVIRWENDLPANVNTFIAGRLQKMLDRTNDIDYTAELVEKYGKKQFVNRVYESKNTEWKQGFRAGKEVTEAARTFAKQWLQELKKA
jgi:hypothetical protein